MGAANVFTSDASPGSHAAPAAAAAVSTHHRYRLIWSSKNDGYLYRRQDGALIFADHSGDDRYGRPHGPEACEDPARPIDVVRFAAGVTCDHQGRYNLPISGGYTAVVCKQVIDKVREQLDIKEPGQQLVALDQLLTRYEGSDSSEAKHVAEFLRAAHADMDGMSAEEQIQLLASSAAELRDDAARVLQLLRRSK